MDAAEAITDRMVTRELYAKGVATRISRQLTELERALIADLGAAMARLSAKDDVRFQEGNYTTQRLQRLIAIVQQFSIDWADVVRLQLESDAFDLIEAEIEFERRYLAAFAADAGIAVTLDATISPRQIFNGAKRRPMDTALMREVFPEMMRKVKKRVTESLRLSYQAGDSVGQAMTRLRSDRQLGINRRGAEGLARTGLAHYANTATLDALTAMGVDKVQWVSTLDGRTTDLCQSLDGRVFNINNPRMPKVPRHFRCRSAIVAYLGKLSDEGFRQAKGPDGSMEVPAGMNYEEWLRKQPKEFAREVLGGSKYAVWAKGVPVTEFTDRYATRAFTAKEVMQRNASLFANMPKAA